MQFVAGLRPLDPIGHIHVVALAVDLPRDAMRYRIPGRRKAKSTSWVAAPTQISCPFHISSRFQIRMWCRLPTSLRPVCHIMSAASRAAASTWAPDEI
jgi:hypothetical protein